MDAAKNAQPNSNGPYVHHTASIEGRVEIADGASVFAFVVMRSGNRPIRIGTRTNIQEFTSIQSSDIEATEIGEDCSICTRASLSNCMVANRCLIGVNASILEGAKIGPNSIVCEYALVERGAEFEANSIIAGIPAKKIADRDNSNITRLRSAMNELVRDVYSYGEDRFTKRQFERASMALKASIWNDAILKRTRSKEPFCDPRE